MQQDPDPREWRDAVVRSESSLAEAAMAAKACRACRLWERGTQTVFGAGPELQARVVLVGEQPGDREDKIGKPFVGPAGKLLDEALEEAGIDRRTAYLTNVVKHFSWEERGKRRIHKKPKADEIRACRPWLEAELAAIHPELVVCLGATAAQVILGPDFRVTEGRGRMLSAPLAPRVMATVHPSSVLRAADDDARELEFRMFVADLAAAARALKTRGTSPGIEPGRPASRERRE